MRRSRKPLTGLPRSGVQTERQRGRCAVRRRRTEQPGAQLRASVPEGAQSSLRAGSAQGCQACFLLFGGGCLWTWFFYGEVAERLNAAVSKTVNGLAPFGGSNPSLSAIQIAQPILMAAAVPVSS